MTKKSIHERILAILEREEAYKASLPPEMPKDTKRQCWNARQNLLGHFSDEQIKQFIQDYLNGNLNAPALHFLEDIEKLALVHHFEPKPAIDRAKFYGGELAADGLSLLPRIIKMETNLSGGRKQGVEAKKRKAKDRQADLENAVSALFKHGQGHKMTNEEITDFLLNPNRKISTYSRQTTLKYVKRIAAKHRA